MHLPDATPPYPLETVEDRRFVLLVDAWMGGVGAPLLLLVAVLFTAPPVLWGYAVTAALGGAHAILALRGAPRNLRVAVRIALLAAIFVTVLVLPRLSRD